MRSCELCLPAQGVLLHIHYHRHNVDGMRLAVPLNHVDVGFGRSRSCGSMPALASDVAELEGRFGKIIMYESKLYLLAAKASRST